MTSRLDLSIGSSTVLLRRLFVVILVLTVFSIIGDYAKFILGHGRLLGFVPEFRLDAENNIPTYFSGLLLLSASVLLGLIARLHQETRSAFRRHWIGLSAIFAYLSVDEVTSLHERLIDPIQGLLAERELIGAMGGVFYFAWVVPAVALLLVLGIVYLRFFWHLPRRWKGLFALAGGLYVGGGLGVEFIGGAYLFQTGDGSFRLAMISTVEEVMEMTGVSVFLYALLEYVKAHLASMRILFAPEDVASRSRAETQPEFASNRDTALSQSSPSTY